MTAIKFDTVTLQFEKFLSTISNILTCENEVNIIRNKLQRHFNAATLDYLCSNEFTTSLNQIQNAFVENKKSTKYFTLLASFDEQLKRHSIKLTRTTFQPSNVSSSTTVSAEPNAENDTTTQLTQSKIEHRFSMIEIQETLEYLLDQCCIISSEPEISLTVDIPPETIDSTHERKIKKLERRLIRISRMIRELEEKDMSLEEMAHCDLYTVESNLKKQACEMYEKLAKLKKQSSSTERILHRPIVLTNASSDHPLITKDLEDMVNQSKHFPSFSDVLSTVESANTKYQLHLNEESRKTLAEKSFKIIGKQIKDRRMADFNDIMSSRLPEDFNIEQNDPALDNAEITQVLLKNEREAIIKTEQIFEEFSQITPDPDAEINIESTENESGTESEEHPPPAVHAEESSESQCEIMEIDLAPEPNSEISLDDRTVTILTTASLPPKPATHERSSPSILKERDEVQTLVPRRKGALTENEIIYKLYRQRLTNNNTTTSSDVVRKRPLTRVNDCSTVKKSKQQIPELIILD
ncbi:unnamed protein product [Adineta ricciae]|uniref:Daxx histone-binding domain-containing protein n=1 Tax=Adineta ricciae TaxID=249248 RepID=A0A814A3N5_ADIRI|nr:unnamed protein product [Adineta ricciae]CAF0908985.1 unnamed protein product [Adineta ricciae]